MSKVECTEVSANWCPLCGDCACPIIDGETYQDDLETLGKNSERCPLHAPWSKHGERCEPETVETIWGSFEIEPVEHVK